MDEDVDPARLADDEAIALKLVEPFDAHRLERAGIVLQLGRIDPVGIPARDKIGVGAGRGRQIKADHATRLQAAIALDHLAHDACALGQSTAIMIAQHREMEKNIALTIVSNDETEAARGVEPLHASGCDDRGKQISGIARDRSQSLPLDAISCGKHRHFGTLHFLQP